MLVKATISFSGAVTMAVGEVRDIPEGAVLSDLLSCGYVVTDKSEELETLKEAVKADDTKRGKG